MRLFSPLFDQPNDMPEPGLGWQLFMRPMLWWIRLDDRYERWRLHRRGICLLAPGSCHACNRSRRPPDAKRYRLESKR